MTTVLVLEDDPDLLNLYTRALKFRGYDVHFTDSAENAISLLDQHTLTPDVAVLDMSMPGLPGSAVVQHIRGDVQYRHMPIIVISCNEDFRKELRESNVTFMTKPINIRDLYNAVAEFVM